MNTHTLKEPLQAFHISSPNPELKGLEVAFDCEGFVGIRCVEDRSKGFILTRESSLTLAELIISQQTPDHFTLAE